MKQENVTTSNVQAGDFYLPRYSIREVSEMTGLSAHTLRYYDKVHLFPFLHRDENNTRVFCDADIDWINLIQCLRKTDLPIESIKRYVELNHQGDATLEERYQMLCEQEKVLLNQIDEIKFGLECLQRKKEYYQSERNRVAKKQEHSSSTKHISNPVRNAG